MTSLILAIFSAVLFVIFLFIWIKMKRDKGRPKSYDTTKIVIGYVCLGLFVAAAACTWVSSTCIVKTKEIGIVTSFGRPLYPLNNGFHFKRPGTNVTELDGAIQTDSHLKSNGTKAGAYCVRVRLANQSIGCSDVSIKWRIREGAATSLFKNYRDFPNIKDSLVTRELTSALNKAASDYNPLSVDDQGNIKSKAGKNLSGTVTKLMKSEVGSQIEVLNVFIPITHFSKATQARLDALQTQIAQTRIAEQAEKTATAQAAANNKLSASVSNDPYVLVSKCFDLLNERTAKGYSIPTGFSCWPGGSSAIVVPSK